MRYTRQGELTCIRRTARVTAALLRGEGLTIQEVSEMTGLTPRGARYLMDALSNVLPIYRDEDGGVWQVCEFKELLGSNSS